MKRILWFSASLGLLCLISMTQLFCRGAPASVALLLPMEPGTRWVYDASVAAEEEGEVRSQKLSWEMEVQERLSGLHFEAAVVRGVPTALIGYDLGGGPVALSILVQTAQSGLYLLPERRLDESRRAVAGGASIQFGEEDRTLAWP